MQYESFPSKMREYVICTAWCVFSNRYKQSSVLEMNRWSFYNNLLSQYELGCLSKHNKNVETYSSLTETNWLPGLTGGRESINHMTALLAWISYWEAWGQSYELYVYSHILQQMNVPLLKKYYLDPCNLNKKVHTKNNKKEFKSFFFNLEIIIFSFLKWQLCSCLAAGRSDTCFNLHLIRS